jgi:hypothetical protein
MVDALQAVGNLVQGSAGYESGKYNRKASNDAALDAERDGVLQEERIRDAARQAMGAQVAAQGSNGFQAGTGTALDALHQSAINATLDALTARRQAQAKARALRAQGAIAYAAGKNAAVAGSFGAAASLAGNASDWASARSGTTSGSTSSGGGYGGGPTGIDGDGG